MTRMTTRNTLQATVEYVNSLSSICEPAQNYKAIGLIQLYNGLTKFQVRTHTTLEAEPWAAFSQPSCHGKYQSQ